MNPPPPGPLDAAIALDGWVGAIVGAISSIVVAVVVLKTTLRHERHQFREQLAQERNSFAEQAERERNLAIEQERIRSFADLAAELMHAEERIGSLPVDDAFLPVVSAFHRWTLYIPEIDDEFVKGVNRGIGTVRETAQLAVRLAREHAENPDVVSARAVSVHFDARGGGEHIHWLIRNGREWHLNPLRRRSLEEAILKRFPRRLSVDVESGEAGYY